MEKVMGFITCILQYVTHSVKTHHFRTFLKFLLIVSLLPRVKKEYTAEVSASYDVGGTALDSWNC